MAILTRSTDESRGTAISATRFKCQNRKVLTACTWLGTTGFDRMDYRSMKMARPHALRVMAQMDMEPCSRKSSPIAVSAQNSGRRILLKARRLAATPATRKTNCLELRNQLALPKWLWRLLQPGMKLRIHESNRQLRDLIEAHR